ncbi:probable serine/threonine-protein kinase PBL19 isoform X3 [Rhododendron vialii]|uniref:probable serine/threonine-protein kinase PBL19 isoform X2 n=1 Tax=Rhododendron vialii TaxID=182163 RepID=UPI002660281B|nr:probable serine/threonine-protein kinase PBL19 isoform X2 [Rhododendron vialii]XP_058226874.1 probable serine/threonine-protein kinase PBL19 isoform X3 [Rhododendron vialii]
MKCFFPFRDKFKCRKGRSSPELQTQNRNSENSAANRVIKSSGSGSVSSPRSIPQLYKEKEHNLRVFTFAELRTATNNFNKLLKIGEGGFGSVYKGSIRPPNGEADPTVVAIKKLNKNGLQGHKQWLTEVQFLGVVDHPNLVKLLGYCSIDGERGIQRLLVYEYMPNKSLEEHLFNKASATLPWKTRLEIILGAAQGLAYLHEGLEIQVIYRDFKSSNVLLDENFKPKLSDFGLAREGPIGDRTHVSTAVIGTYGYAAPEYVDTGHLTIKSDIYSFGVVVYEMLTGRRTLERHLPPVEQKLIEWVKLYPADSNGFRMIIDPRLNQYSLSAARKIATLADACLNKNAKDRPTMSQVVEILKQAIEESEGGSSSYEKRSFESSTSNLVPSKKHSFQMLPQPKDTSVRV